MMKCCRPSARGDLYSCDPTRSERKRVISKWGLPNKAGIPNRDATICAKNAPLLLPTNTQSFSCWQMFSINANAFFGCKGRSGVRTSALSTNACFNVCAGMQQPEAKKPWRKRIFVVLIVLCEMFQYHLQYHSCFLQYHLYFVDTVKFYFLISVISFSTFSALSQNFQENGFLRVKARIASVP